MVAVCQLARAHKILCIRSDKSFLEIRQHVRLKDRKEQETSDLQGTPDTRLGEVGYGKSPLLAPHILGMSAAH